jgi:hypothetical protein
VKPRRKPVQRELMLQRAIWQYLTIKGVFCWICEQPLIPGRGRKMYHHSSKGVSDILGIVGGRPLAIEVKVGSNTPTDQQNEFLDQFQEAGGIAFVAYSIGDVEEALFPNTNKPRRKP